MHHLKMGMVYAKLNEAMELLISYNNAVKNVFNDLDSIIIILKSCYSDACYMQSLQIIYIGMP